MVNAMVGCLLQTARKAAHVMAPRFMDAQAQGKSLLHHDRLKKQGMGSIIIKKREKARILERKMHFQNIQNAFSEMGDRKEEAAAAGSGDAGEGLQTKSGRQLCLPLFYKGGSFGGVRALSPTVKIA